MTPRKPVRVMLAASVCVVASAGAQGSPARADNSDPQIEQVRQWRAISDAYTKGELAILGQSGGQTKLAQDSGFRNIASPFGNGT
jgi:hypothetical protein